MSGKKISELELLSAADVNIEEDVFAIVDTSADATKKITVESVLELISLGSDIAIGTTPILSGNAGRIIFQGSGNVVQQSSDLFWDYTNSRLSIGIGTPGARVDIKAQGALSTDITIRMRNSAGSADLFYGTGAGGFVINGNVGINTGANPAVGQTIMADTGYYYGLHVHANSISTMYSCYLAQPYNHGFYMATLGVGAGYKAENPSNGHTIPKIAFSATDFGTNSSNNVGVYLNIENTGAGNAYALQVYNGDFFLDGTNGHKIATANTQKISFWGATPIVQPTTAIAAATFTGGGGTTLTDTDTFDGYTLKQVVKALRNMGLLA